MTKKLISLFIATVILYMLFPLGLTSVSAETEGYYTYTVTDSEATITKVDAKISGDIIIPSTLGGYPVTSIGASAFSQCANLTSVIIPDCVTSIGDSAFIFCSNLTNIKLPNGLTSITHAIFKGCRSLTNITIPDTVTSIEATAFYNCSSFTSVTIPDGVTKIGSFAFRDCSNLTVIRLPKNLETIGNRLFYGCTELKDIIIDEENQYFSFENGILYNKDKTEVIQCLEKTAGDIILPDSVAKFYPHAFWNCNNITSVLIPDSVTIIDNVLFMYCSNLAKVQISKNMTAIHNLWLSHCESLTEIIVDSENNSYSSKDGVLYNKDKTKLIRWPDGKSSDDAIIPNSVSTINTYAFYCSGIKSITLPDSLKIIEAHAFHNCTELTDIVIPDDVTDIKQGAFFGCASLASITIPHSINSIAPDAFYYCLGLDDIYYDGSPEEWANIFPNGNTALNNITVHYSKEYEPDPTATPSATATPTATPTASPSATPSTTPTSAPSAKPSATPTAVPSATPTIAPSAKPSTAPTATPTTAPTAKPFEISNGVIIKYNGSDTNLEIPSEIDGETITAIGYRAFYECDNLKNITIPDSVTSIAADAFD